jgi:hypothetical protein
MKQTFLFTLLLLQSIFGFTQAPNKMSYQAVVRNSNNTVVSNHAVGMRISILQGTATGSSVYTETQSPTTNANGLIAIEIGTGTILSGSFANIDWANGPYFVKTETDPNGGSNYTLTGTSQLLSVPYALYAKKTDTASIAKVALNAIPSGGQNGQILTMCNGVPVWTNNGLCPGIWALGTVFCNGTPTAIVNVTNPITGKTWMDRNLGASKAATSSSDATTFGDLYQWGRAADGHQCRNSLTISTLSTSDQANNDNFIISSSNFYDWRSTQNDNLWQGINGTNNPCPLGYRIPTYNELVLERTSWSQNNSTGALNSPLKLPLPGFRTVTGSIIDVGNYSWYWSSNVSGTYVWYLYIYSGNAAMFTDNRANGASVRCIKD